MHPNSGEDFELVPREGGERWVRVSISAGPPSVYIAEGGLSLMTK